MNLFKSSQSPRLSQSLPQSPRPWRNLFFIHTIRLWLSPRINRLKRLCFSDQKPLWSLFLLGFIGGVLFEAGDILIRIWSKDMSLSPKTLDLLNTIEILHPLKFLWAPIFSIPIFLGPWTNRRAWILITLMVSVSAIAGLCLSAFFGWAFLGFLCLLTIARASYDALVIASQMDAVSASHWGWSENFCVMGYRIGIMALGYASLHASLWLSWPHIYWGVAALIVIGIIFMAYSPLFHFLNTIQASKPERLWDSIRNWMTLPGSALVLTFLLIYRLQDGLIDPQREYFLLDMGLSKIELAYLKTMGLWGTIAGGFAAGACIRYKGYRFTLYWGLIFHGCAGGLLCLASGYAGPLYGGGKSALSMAYCLEQTTKGWSTIAIYSLQLLCCQGNHVISQVAFFSALSDFGLKVISMRSGWLVQEYGYRFLLGAGSLCGLPALAMISSVFSKTFIYKKTLKKE